LDFSWLLDRRIVRATIEGQTAHLQAGLFRW